MSNILGAIFSRRDSPEIKYFSWTGNSACNLYYFQNVGNQCLRLPLYNVNDIITDDSTHDEAFQSLLDFFFYFYKSLLLKFYHKNACVKVTFWTVGTIAE